MDRFTSIKVEISKEKKQQAKSYAKSKGMTFSGWLGQLIDRELQKANPFPSSPSISYNNTIPPCLEEKDFLEEEQDVRPEAN